jgi:hypothetical protein
MPIHMPGILIQQRRQGYFEDHLRGGQQQIWPLRPLFDRGRKMPKDTNGLGASHALSRRSLFKQLGVAGTVAAVSEIPIAPSVSAHPAHAAPSPAPSGEAVDTYAQATKGAPFAELPAAGQDAVLREMEKNTATGFVPNSVVFFEMVRAHTIQGTFCDPYYGGNANFVGWDLIGYPGIRMAVSEDEQRMKPKPPAVRESAYDGAMFTMKGGSHGH